MQTPASKDNGRVPLNLPLPANVWKRIIRAVNTRECVTLHIRFAGGRVVKTSIEKDMDEENEDKDKF